MVLAYGICRLFWAEYSGLDSNILPAATPNNAYDKQIKTIIMVVIGDHLLLLFDHNFTV